MKKHDSNTYGDIKTHMDRGANASKPDAEFLGDLKHRFTRWTGGSTWRRWTSTCSS